MKKMGLRARINQNCRDCIYDQVGGNGTWKQQVKACTSLDCAFYPIRPLPQIGKKSGMKLETGAKRGDTHE